MIVGTFSSVFLATPLEVTLRNREARARVGSVRISAPSSVIAIVCSVCAVRAPVALRSVQPSASVTS